MVVSGLASPDVLAAEEIHCPCRVKRILGRRWKLSSKEVGVRQKRRRKKMMC